LRSDAACPACLSLERTRLLWLYLQRELGFPNLSGRMLHLAPEYILRKRFLSLKHQNPDFTYHNADLDPELADEKADIQALPYPKMYFSWVICSHVLGHVPDEGRAIREIGRVLKPNGIGLLMTVRSGAATTLELPEQGITPADKLRLYGEPDLLRLHGDDFCERIRAAGLQVQDLDYREKFSAEDQIRYGLGNGLRERIYLVKKGSDNYEG
jgi:SAM-dependent methyltransferase